MLVLLRTGGHEQGPRFDRAKTPDVTGVMMWTLAEEVSLIKFLPGISPERPGSPSSLCSGRVPREHHGSGFQRERVVPREQLGSEFQRVRVVSREHHRSEFQRVRGVTREVGDRSGLPRDTV